MVDNHLWTGGSEMNDRVRTGLRIPYDLNTNLMLMAERQGISKNALILQILWDWLKGQKEEGTG